VIAVSSTALGLTSLFEMGRGEHQSYQPHKVFAFVYMVMFCMNDLYKLRYFLGYNIHLILWKMLKSKNIKFITIAIKDLRQYIQ